MLAESEEAVCEDGLLGGGAVEAGDVGGFVALFEGFYALFELLQEFSVGQKSERGCVI